MHQQLILWVTCGKQQSKAYLWVCGKPDYIPSPNAATGCSNKHALEKQLFPTLTSFATTQSFVELAAVHRNFLFALGTL